MEGNFPIIIKPALEDAFWEGWAHCRVILFSAPCGCGKTSAAAALLRERAACVVRTREGDTIPEYIPPTCEAILVDDLQLLDEPGRQTLAELINTRHRLHFILLTRGQLPGWLMPLQLEGELCLIETPLLLFDRETARQMLAARGAELSPGEISAVQRDFNGYPIALELLSRRLERDGRYDETMLGNVKRDLFIYYEEAVFRRFDPHLRELLLDIAPFEPIHPDLAKIVSGDSHAGELLGKLQRDTTMLLYDGLDVCRFRPIFREFLLWESQQKQDGERQKALYGRAALYYELHDEPARALECYSRAGEMRRVSELLVRNAELHPGVGHYYEMAGYYLALPREEILRSPSLMCGMSMLTALCLDYEASEQWYAELHAYADRLSRTDSEYRTVRGKIAYLDIALPQRGSTGLIDVIVNVFRVMTDKQVRVPAFSVTSTLPSIMNGGKDFSEWSKKDDLLYATMRRPVESILGRDGVGLPECSICESKFEKGEDVSKRLLNLMSRLGEIQAKGTPDIEFAVIGLLARVQVSQGRAREALEALENLRTKFLTDGESRFQPNMDAMICRIRLYLNDTDSAERWLREKAPGDGTRLWALWRYQYMTKAMVQIKLGDCAAALLTLVPLVPYCRRCGRVMDGIYIGFLTAICHYRTGDPAWDADLSDTLDICWEYGFLWPAAQYGAALLPLLRESSWAKNAAFRKRLLGRTRLQAVNYPDFLKLETPLLEPLSAAELQVLKLLCHNMSNNEIGEMLDIKLPTVKTHVSHILQKLGVSRRSEAKAAAEKLHLL